MKYTLEIQKIVIQVEDNPNNTPKDNIRLLKQAIAIADENDDIEWGYDLRLMLIRKCYHLSSDTELVNNFSWVLNAYEEHPDWFDENDFLWQYKWILATMYNNPDVSLEQIESILEDFKTRLERNGYGLRAYYDRLYTETLSIGNYEKAKELLDLRNAAPDDGMGNCAACTLDYELDYYMETGQIDEALTRAQPLIDKLVSCALVPARTFCALAYHAEKAGKPDVAADLFERADADMSIIENDENLTSAGGMLIAYLANKNEEKTKHYLELCIPWTLEADSFSQYDFAAYMLEALNKWKGADPIILNLPLEYELYNDAGEYSIQVLKEYYREKAKTLAEAFDKRNRCETYAKRVLAL